MPARRHARPLLALVLAVLGLCGGAAARGQEEEPAASPPAVAPDAPTPAEAAGATLEVGLAGTLLALGDGAVVVQTETERLTLAVSDRDTLCWQLGAVRGGVATLLPYLAKGSKLDCGGGAAVASGKPGPPDGPDSAGVRVAVDRRQGSTALSRLELTGVPISWERRAQVLLAVTLGAWVLAALLLGRGCLPRLVVGEDNRYSNSKFQMVFWFAAVAVTYIAAAVLRLWMTGGRLVGGVGIPENLLLLSGLSALTYAGAKAVSMTQRGELDQAQSRARAEEAARQQAAAQHAAAADSARRGLTDETQAPRHEVAAATEEARARAAGERAAVIEERKRQMDNAGGRPSFPGDLFRDNGGRIDIGDFQMVIVTLLAVGQYLASVFDYLQVLPLGGQTQLPDVDTTVLAAFGIGQGAYLTKKYVAGPGGSPEPEPPPPPGDGGEAGGNG